MTERLKEQGATGELLDRVRALTGGLQESRARAQNMEFVLAATHQYQRIVDGIGQSDASTSRSNDSAVRSTAVESTAAREVPPTLSTVVGQSSTGVSIAGSHEVDRPTTPVATQTAKRAAGTPGSGRKGRKKKAQRVISLEDRNETDVSNMQNRMGFR